MSVKVRAVNFGHDSGCLACVTDQGFMLFNCFPLRQVCSVNLGGSLVWVEPIFRCNLVALVAGGSKPAFSLNKVVIYDCSLHKTLVELNLNSKVVCVRINRDKIVVFTEHKAQVFTFSDIPEFLLYIDTSFNPNGIGAISVSEPELLVYPSLIKGHVGLSWLSPTHPRTHKFKAHDHCLQLLNLNSNGSLLATASVKGTLVRVFDTITCNLLYELRRGSQDALISSITFSRDSCSLCVCSNHSTVHLYNLFHGLRTGFFRKCMSFKGQPSGVRLHVGNCTGKNLMSIKGVIVVIGPQGMYHHFELTESGEYQCLTRRLLTELAPVQ